MLSQLKLCIRSRPAAISIRRPPKPATAVGCAPAGALGFQPVLAASGRRRPARRAGGTGVPGRPRCAAPLLPGSAKGSLDDSLIPVIVVVKGGPCKTADRVKVVGSQTGLGAWDLRKAPDLKRLEGGTWLQQVMLPLGDAYFKAFCRMKDGSEVWEEQIQNRFIKVKQNGNQGWTYHMTFNDASMGETQTETLQHITSLLPLPVRSTGTFAKPGFHPFFPDTVAVQRCVTLVNNVARAILEGRPLSRRTTSVYLIEGESGLGKTCFLKYLEEHMTQHLEREPEPSRDALYARTALEPSSTVTGIWINFNGAADFSDCFTAEDVGLSASQILGVRVLAHQYCTTTSEFRQALQAAGLQLPAGACGLSNVLKQCRSLHPGENWTCLLKVDELQLLEEQALIKGVPPEQAAELPKEMVKVAGYILTRDAVGDDEEYNRPLLSSQGLIFVPFFAGTALTAAERAVPTLLRKALLSLQTLSIENSQRLLESYILRDASWRQQQAELRALLASEQMVALLESLGGVPGLITDFLAEAMDAYHIARDIRSVFRFPDQASQEDVTRLVRAIESEVTQSLLSAEGGAPQYMGGELGQLQTMLVACCGIAVKRAMRVGSPSTTVEAAGWPGTFTMREIKGTDVALQMVPLRLKMYAEKLEGICVVNYPTLMLRQLVPTTEVLLGGRAFELMIAARLVAGSVINMQLLGHTHMPLGQLFNNRAVAVDSNKLLEQVKIVQLQTARDDTWMLVPKPGSVGGARQVDWAAERQVSVSNLTASATLKSGKSRNIDLLDPGFIVHLDPPSRDCPGFDLRLVLTRTNQSAAAQVMVLISAKRLPRDSGSVADKLLQDGISKAARAAARQAGERLGFDPIFVYITTGNVGLQAAIANLQADGEDDVIIVAGDDLGGFMPLMRMRPSLIARQ